MKYIGPFFRINSLTSTEIESQLFYLSREAVKHIVLESRCGLITSLKNSKKSLSNYDINILKDFSPLLCIYKKGHPKFSSSKHFHGWDEDGLKKEATISSNALMTLCILELANFYEQFENKNINLYSLSNIYKVLAKDQLDFYSSNLRNADGVFVDKKNTSESNSEFAFIDKDKKFKFSDQAFMMSAYYLYSQRCLDDPDKEIYKNFALDILSMFINFKENIYALSFEECCKICFSFNIFYHYSSNEECKAFLIDLTDYLLDKYGEKNYLFDNLDYSCLLAINLILSYKNTGIVSFKDGFIELSERHKKLFSDDLGIFIKPIEKKDIKYSSNEIHFYLVSMLLYEETIDDSREIKTMISSLYKQLYVNSGIVLSWPDAPSLDSVERYRNLTLNSDDLIEETMFRMTTLPNPENTGTAPIFLKSINYNKKKESFSQPKSSFDSSKNFMNFFLIIYLFNNKLLKYFFNCSPMIEEKVEPLEKKKTEASKEEENLETEITPQPDTQNSEA